MSQILVRNKIWEIEHYSPCLASSFNGGLGSVVPRSFLNKIIEGKDWRIFLKRRYELQVLINEKQFDPLANRFREFLKRRIQSLMFDGSSDNDFQFGELNDMAQIGLCILRRNVGERVRIPQLVDAVIFYRRPDLQNRLERPVYNLCCGRCRKRRSFIRLNGSVICLGCRREISERRARFHISIKKLNLQYVDLIHSQVMLRMNGKDDRNVGC